MAGIENWSELPPEWQAGALAAFKLEENNDENKAVIIKWYNAAFGFKKLDKAAKWYAAEYWRNKGPEVAGKWFGSTHWEDQEPEELAMWHKEDYWKDKSSLAWMWHREDYWQDKPAAAAKWAEVKYWNERLEGPTDAADWHSEPYWRGKRYTAAKWDAEWTIPREYTKGAVAAEWHRVKYWEKEGPKVAAKWYEYYLTEKEGGEGPKVAAKWHEAEYSLDSAKKWSEAGVSGPEKVKDWENAGHDSDYAEKWFKAGVKDPEKIKDWENAGHDSDSARKWLEAGISDPEEAEQWKGLFGEDFFDIRVWKEAFPEFEDARKWKGLFKELYVVKDWQKKFPKFEDAKEWKELSKGSLHEAKEWKKVFPKIEEATQWKGEFPRYYFLAKDWKEAFNGNLQVVRQWRALFDEGKLEKALKWKKAFNSDLQLIRQWRTVFKEGKSGEALKWYKAGYKVEDVAKKKKEYRDQHITGISVNDEGKIVDNKGNEVTLADRTGKGREGNTSKKAVIHVSTSELTSEEVEALLENNIAQKIVFKIKEGIKKLTIHSDTFESLGEYRKLSIHLPENCRIRGSCYLEKFKNVNVKQKKSDNGTDAPEGGSPSFPEGITLEDNVLKVGEGFERKIFRNNIKIPRTVKKIDLSAGKNIKTIDVSACSNLPSLEEIILPPKLKTIGQYAFSKCKNLKKVKFNADGTLNIQRNAFKGSKAKKVVIDGFVQGIKMQNYLEFEGIEEVRLKNDTIKLFMKNKEVSKEEFFNGWVDHFNPCIRFIPS